MEWSGGAASRSVSGRAAVVLALVFAACSSDGTSGGGGGGQSGGQVCGDGFHLQACAFDADCYSGNCQGSSCYLGKGCTTDADCLQYYPGEFVLRNGTAPEPKGKIQWAKCFAPQCAFYCDVLK